MYTCFATPIVFGIMTNVRIDIEEQQTATSALEENPLPLVFGLVLFALYNDLYKILISKDVCVG
jgi:hypothetical protein